MSYTTNQMAILMLLTGKVKRIVAGKEDVLTALFERTFSGLSPVARRIFLTLANWRSTIPEIALEAVLMRQVNEHMDVEKGVEELFKSSLINIDKSERDGMRFISVPLSAAVFGKKKLSVSPMKTAIEADTKLLHTFGVGLNTEIHLGIEPRIIKFFRDIAKRVSLRKDTLENYIPILEFICRKYPNAWLTLSSLYEEENLVERAIASMQSYMELPLSEHDKVIGWQRLASLYYKNGEWLGELHAIIEQCEVSIIPTEKIKISVNRVNQLFRANKLLADSNERQILAQRIAVVFKRRLDNEGGDAADYSQLAWLLIQINDRKGARKAVIIGLEKEPDNLHCLKLKDTLNF